MRASFPGAGRLIVLALAVAGCKGAPPTSSGAIAKEPTRLYWGDTHVHSSYSADAYALGNRTADPRTAYRYAKGLPVVHPGTQARVQIGVPLDFLVVADHAETLGRASRRAEPTAREMDVVEARRAAWAEIIAAAEEHYAPCSFTSMIAWEWTAAPEGKDAHRVVLMSGGQEQARELLPFTATDGSKPEQLWEWLEETSERVGTDFIAIPHNSNLSAGAMFDGVDDEGRPLTESYARMRAKWEPIAEVTQTQGDSETHPALSPDDDFADFERLPPSSIDGEAGAEVREGDYLRSALARGLQIEGSAGTNPYKFGLIGSTGSHTGLSSVEEHDFAGRAAFDSIPEDASEVVLPGILGADASASGLAAVWAEENTRTALFAAFKRREVYATTGPRIRLRFFGGWHFHKKNASMADMVQIGYTLGRPMGSDLTKAPEDEAPKFLMYAVKDPRGANLDRIQIVKGWVDSEGQAHERIYDVAVAGGHRVDERGRVEPLPSTVDLRSGTYVNAFGAPRLSAYWEDSEFDPNVRAFYYVRVLQIPTPRHSLQGAIAIEKNPDETGRPPTIQERAYSSPIWYTP